MAETNNVVVRVGLEPSFGGVLAGAMANLNVLDVNLTENPTITAPGGLHGNPMALSANLLANSGSGTINTQLQFGNADALMEGLQRNAFSSQVSITSTGIAFNGTTGAITDSGNGLGAIQVGDLIFISGAATAGNNGWKGIVTAAAAGSITVPASQLTTESAGASVVVKFKRCRNGTTVKHYSLEWLSSDLSGSLWGAQGHVVNEATHTLASGAYATMNFTTSGKAPATLASTLSVAGSPTAAPSDVTFPFMNSLDNVSRLFVGGVANSSIITSLSLKATNNAEAVTGIGGATADPKAMRLGGITTALELDLYLDAAGLAVEALAKARSIREVWWSVTDSAGNSYAFVIPACQLQTTNREVGGENKAIMVKVTAAGSWHRTYDYQFAIYSHAVA